MANTASRITQTDAYGAPVIDRALSHGRVTLSLGALQAPGFNCTRLTRDETSVYLDVRGPIAADEVDGLVADLQAMRDQARAYDQQDAVDQLIQRIDTVEDWAAAIDQERPDLGGATRAFDAVVTAWGRSAPSEDDGPVVMACYARALLAAVDEAANAVADHLQSDPRTNGALGSTLHVPQVLAA